MTSMLHVYYPALVQAGHHIVCCHYCFDGIARLLCGFSVRGRKLLEICIITSYHNFLVIFFRHIQYEKIKYVTRYAKRDHIPHFNVSSNRRKYVANQCFAKVQICLVSQTTIFCLPFSAQAILVRAFVTPGRAFAWSYQSRHRHVNYCVNGGCGIMTQWCCHSDDERRARSSLFKHASKPRDVPQQQNLV